MPGLDDHQVRRVGAEIPPARSIEPTQAGDACRTLTDRHRTVPAKSDQQGDKKGQCRRPVDRGCAGRLVHPARDQSGCRRRQRPVQRLDPGSPGSRQVNGIRRSRRAPLNRRYVSTQHLKARRAGAGRTGVCSSRKQGAIRSHTCSLFVLYRAVKSRKGNAREGERRRQAARSTGSVRYPADPVCSCPAVSSALHGSLSRGGAHAGLRNRFGKTDQDNPDTP